MPASPEESRNKLKVVTAARNPRGTWAGLALNDRQLGFATITTGKELCLNGTGLSSEEVNCNGIKGGYF